MSRKLAPCGTPGAAKRHRRRDEPVCGTCAAAEAHYVARWRSGANFAPDPAGPAGSREIRNGLPAFRPYVYRGTGEDVLTGHLDDEDLEMAS